MHLVGFIMRRGKMNIISTYFMPEPVLHYAVEEAHSNYLNEKLCEMLWPFI